MRSMCCVVYLQNKPHMDVMICHNLIWLTTSKNRQSYLKNNLLTLSSFYKYQNHGDDTGNAMYNGNKSTNMTEEYVSHNNKACS